MGAGYYTGIGAGDGTASGRSFTIKTGGMHTGRRLGMRFFSGGLGGGWYPAAVGFRLAPE